MRIQTTRHSLMLYRCGPEPSLKNAYLDLSSSCSQFSHWFACGFKNFSSNYRRAALGKLWLSLQIILWGLAFVLLFSGSNLSESVAPYGLYATSGLLFWQVLQASLAGGAKIFTSSTRIILNIPRPYFSYIIQWWGEVTGRFIFQLLGFATFLIAYRSTPNMNTLLLLPGLLLLFVGCTCLATLCAIVGLRYRDLPMAIESMMRFLFFATPVFWVSRGNGLKEHLAFFNPLAHMLDVVRLPLLGIAPPGHSWVVASTFSATCCLLTLVIFKSARNKLVYWM